MSARLTDTAVLPPALGHLDRLTRRVALGAVISLALALLGLGLILHTPTLASATPNSNPDPQVQKEQSP